MHARRRSHVKFVPTAPPAPPSQTAKRKYVRAGIGKTYQCHDSHLRHFRAEQQQGLQVCVRIRLAGGLQLVRTACGAGV